jgi:ribosomal-protein-alanine N-acetyltransferase
VATRSAGAPDPPRLALEGERVRLRAPTWADEDEYLSLRRRSWAFLAPWEPEIQGVDPLGPARFERYMRFGERERRERFLICARDGGAMLGSISVSEIDRGAGRATLGYWMGAPHARRGYMTEALRLAIAHASNELGVTRLDAYVLPENEASRGLLAKLGFRLDGVVPRYRVLRGVARDHERWSLDVLAVPRGCGPRSPS